MGWMPRVVRKLAVTSIPYCSSGGWPGSATLELDGTNAATLENDASDLQMSMKLPGACSIICDRSDVLKIRISLSPSAKGIELSRTAFVMLNVEVLMPIPRASMTTETIVNPGDLASRRAANFRAGGTGRGTVCSGGDCACWPIVSRESAEFHPFGRGVALSQALGLTFVEVGPRRRGSQRAQRGRQPAGELLSQPLPIKRVPARRRLPDRSLEQEPALVALLGAPGDLGSGSRVDDVEYLRPLEAHARRTAGLRALGRLGGRLDRGRHPGRVECPRERLVDGAVALRRADLPERMAPRHHQRVRPVVAMVHESFSVRPPAQVEGLAGGKLAPHE